MATYLARSEAETEAAGREIARGLAPDAVVHPSATSAWAKRFSRERVVEARFLNWNSRRGGRAAFAVTEQMEHMNNEAKEHDLPLVRQRRA